MSCWDDQETHAAQPAGMGDAEDGSAAPAAGAAAAEEAGGLSTLLRRRGPDSLFQSLMRLWPREGRRPEASIRTMARLRSAFRHCLSDLMQEARGRDDAPALQRLEAVLRHIVHSQHPQDLWHLRALVYTEVARARSQSEAERRLAALTAQFDLTRSRLKEWKA